LILCLLLLRNPLAASSSFLCHSSSLPHSMIIHNVRHPSSFHPFSSPKSHLAT
jgi:hypothetical protein